MPPPLTKGRGGDIITMKSEPRTRLAPQLKVKYVARPQKQPSLVWSGGCFLTITKHLLRSYPKILAIVKAAAGCAKKIFRNRMRAGPGASKKQVYYLSYKCSKTRPFSISETICRPQYNIVNIGSAASPVCNF